jgi:hypothetical protein
MGPQFEITDEVDPVSACSSSTYPLVSCESIAIESAFKNNLRDCS